MASSKLLKIAVLCLLATTGIHSYLAYHHYETLFGVSGPSLCNINATFNCDAVNASSYSQLLGRPLALWGAFTNLMLAVLIGVSLVLPTPDRDRWQRLSFWMALFVALTSVVMGGISAGILGVLCLFCNAAYILSFVVLGLVAKAQATSPLKNISQDLKTILQRRGPLFILALIPFGVWVTDQMFLKSFVGGPIDKMIDRSVQEWRAEREHQFTTTWPTLEAGASASEASVTLVEFADFRCPHCRDAGPKLHTFIKAHPDARLVFIPFPLDGQCNSAISFKSGLSCRLTKALLCSIEPGHGWAMHDYLFEHQPELNTLSDIDRVIKSGAGQLGLDYAKLEECMTGAKIQEHVTSLAKLGEQAGLQGTPTVYVNGRALNGFQLLPILQAVYREAKSR